MSLDPSKQWISAAKQILAVAGKHLAQKGSIDSFQTTAYDFAWMSSEVYASEQLIAYAERNSGELEATLAQFFAAETITSLSNKLGFHFAAYGINEKQLLETIWKPEVTQQVEQLLASENISRIAKLIQSSNGGGTYGLDQNHEMFRETFKKFAEDKVMPIAEKVHRHDLLIPQEIIDGLKELGCFGLSIPQKYGGFQDDAKPDNTGMVVVTEELSRGSLGIAGSLITRPEILSKAILKGGTEEQKIKWLPLLASGERMAGVAVTEPDFGSDVAGMKVTATRKELNGQKGWVINGVKTWCTFAGYADTLMVLCRTDPDMAKKHKGMSILIAEKPRFEGHEFKHTQPKHNGNIEGKAIPTIGYRGMHSYEVAFENYWVPEENLVGGEKGLGQGFYLQMEGFAGGRLQTAARALGVMQAAFEAALRYSDERKVFGKVIGEYGLTEYKLVRMAALIQACRQATYHACQLMDAGDHKGNERASDSLRASESGRGARGGSRSDSPGIMEASLIKFYASKVSEWVTREALQLHGGYGYAEEYPVSRYFVDARVFSIFEGAEDVLALKVITPALLKQYI